MITLNHFLRHWVIPSGWWNLLASFLAKHKIRQVEIDPKDYSYLTKNNVLKDRHKNNRCFILGSGSSISKQDLTKLNGEIIISVSNSFVHSAYPVIKPKYHVLPPLITSHGRLYETNGKFILWLKEMETKTVNAEMFFHIGDREMIESNNLFLNREIYWNEYVEWNESPITDINLSKVPAIWSVSEYALTVALYMGFKEIYLLGFDHDWFNGPLIYFYDEKKEHLLQPNKERIAFADSEFQMRRHAKIFKKYKYLYALKNNIYNANANPDSYVDVFPKVEFESLFSN